MKLKCGTTDYLTQHLLGNQLQHHPAQTIRFVLGGLKGVMHLLCTVCACT